MKEIKWIDKTLLSRNVDYDVRVFRSSATRKNGKVKISMRICQRAYNKLSKTVVFGYEEETKRLYIKPSKSPLAYNISPYSVRVDGNSVYQLNISMDSEIATNYEGWYNLKFDGNVELFFISPETKIDMEVM